jgi:hypothetical protein
MKFQLVFDHWRDRDGKPVEGEKRIDLEMGSFHGGTTFDAMVDLNADDIIDMQDAALSGFSAVFYVAQDTVVDGAAQLASHMRLERAKLKAEIAILEGQVQSLEGQVEVLAKNVIGDRGKQ